MQSEDSNPKRLNVFPSGLDMPSSGVGTLGRKHPSTKHFSMKHPQSKHLVFHVTFNYFHSRQGAAPSSRHQVGYNSLSASSIRQGVILVSILSSVMALVQPPAVAEDIHRDWVVKVKTEELQRHFDYDGSGLRKIAKATVDYFHESNKDDVKPFERVYFNNGKPIGLERAGPLDLPAAQNTVIKVSTRNETSTEEHKAAANMLWRLSLNITHRRTSLISAILPEKSFDGIVQSLRDLQFTESSSGPDGTNRAKAALSLESEPAGRSQCMYYF